MSKYQRLVLTVTRGGLALFATLAVLLGSAVSAGADPTRHFSGTFELTCGNNTLTLVSKPGSSNVVTVNGEPTNSVSILLGLTALEDGEVVFDFQKAANNPNAITCHLVEPGLEVIVRVINTPPER
jgi:hypothetical protein